MTTAVTLPSNRASPRGQTLTLPPTPWAQVVRGGESPESSSPPPPLSPEKTGESSDKVVNGNVDKKPAWNKPLNGVKGGDHGVNRNGSANGIGDAVSDGGGVIGGSSTWPALSESTRPSLKLTVIDSVKSAVDRSGPTTSNTTPPVRGGSNANPSTGGHNAGPARARVARRDGHHTDHRALNRKGNYGQQHSRGDGRSNNNYCGGHEWKNSSQTQHQMDTHRYPHLTQTLGFGRPYLQVAPPFPVPPPFSPYGNAMAYPDMPPVIYYRPPPPPRPYVAMAEPPLHVSIVRQIDYYFSDANLVKDEYLRKNMDGHGWVKIGLIASFPRVQNLTTNISLILQCLNRLSLVVEVQGEKVRRRDDWKKWLTPNQSPLDSDPPHTADTTEDALAQNLRNTSLQEVNHGQTLDELTKGSQVEKNKETQ